jgi:hypothetical protein
MIQSGPLAIMSLVRYQSPCFRLKEYSSEGALYVRIGVFVDVGEYTIGIFEITVGFGCGGKPFENLGKHLMIIIKK